MMYTPLDNSTQKSPVCLHRWVSYDPNNLGTHIIPINYCGIFQACIDCGQKRKGTIIWELL